MKIIVFSLIAIFIIIFPGQTFASNAGYQWTEKFITHTPTICTVEPSDSLITGTIPQQYMKSVKDAVLEWQYMLQSVAKKPDNWKMNYVEVSKQDAINYDYSKCDITITFKRQFDQQLPEGYGNILGIMLPQGEGRSNIELYFQELGTCSKSDKYYQYIYYCYYNDVVPASEIGLTGRHEFGHALGLGHYLSDDPAQNIRWGTIVDVAPSIMVQFDNQVRDFKKIQQIDINKIKEIYGENGFGTFVKLTPKPVETPNLTINEKIVVSIGPREAKTIKISGEVPAEYYKRGVPLSITMTMPDGSKLSSAIHVTSMRYFEYPMMISYNSMQGQYTITAEFEGHEVKNFSVFLSKSTGTTSPVSVPSNTISSNVAKMHAENAKITWSRDIENLKKESKTIEDTLSGLNINVDTKIDLKTTLDYQKSLKERVNTAQIRYSAGINEMDKGNYEKAQEYFDGLQTDKATVMELKEKIMAQIDNANNQDTSNLQIPQWIKNNAKWYADDIISEDDFKQGIEFLIKNNIIDVPVLEKNNDSLDQKVPLWIKNNAKWWSENQISDDDFLKGIKYLVENRIIKIK